MSKRTKDLVECREDHVKTLREFEVANTNCILRLLGKCEGTGAPEAPAHR